MNIRTHYVYPPIPVRDFDWSAIDEDTYDGAPDAGQRAQMIGFGKTEAEAIADLKQQIEENEEERV